MNPATMLRLKGNQPANRRLLWGVGVSVAALIHFGTAILGVNTFVPFPKLADSAAFLAGAWAIRLGLSPYRWSGELVEALQNQNLLDLPPQVPFNPPVWLWLPQPFAPQDIPDASWMWVIASLMLVAWIASALGRIAGWDRWWHTAAVFFISLTFGPLFLDLTQGQTSTLLLFAVLTIGRATGASASELPVSAALAGGLAIGTKLFPAIWLVVLPLLGHWRLYLLAVPVAAVALGARWVIAPVASRDNIARALPERISSVAGRAGLDDQSLVAWLDRLGRAHTFRAPGLSATRLHSVTWVSPRSVDADTIRGTGFLLCGLLGFTVLAAVYRARNRERRSVLLLGAVRAPSPAAYRAPQPRPASPGDGVAVGARMLRTQIGHPGLPVGRTFTSDASLGNSSSSAWGSWLRIRRIRCTTTGGGDSDVLASR